jgi:hypothetical protein
MMLIFYKSFGNLVYFKPALFNKKEAGLKIAHYAFRLNPPAEQLVLLQNK